MGIEEVKTELIGTFLYREIKRISKSYNCLNITGNFIDDGQLMIYVRNMYHKNDFYSDSMYELSLIDFKEKCDEFIDELEDEMKEVLDYLFFHKNYHIHHISGNSKEYYDSCLLQFGVVDLDIE